MRIEDEIQQKEFTNPYQKVLVNLAFTSGWLASNAKETFKPFGITMQQYNVLRILKGRYPEACSVGEVKEVMLDKSPDLTRLLDRLVEKQLVDRKICPDNRRKVDIKITKKGINLVNKMQSSVSKMEQTFCALSKKEALQLSDLLDKMRGKP